MHETYGCVGESPPLMKLKHDPHGDQTLRLKQGDVYKEYFVDIQDENAEEYLRSLKIAYSIPMPYGCLVDIGEFHVNYTVATPWTSPPYVRLTRRVIIEDINECLLDVNKYKISCPELVPHCDVEAGAKCMNTIGSYTCQCPKHTEGDGFLPNLKTKPTGYEGGTGCRDVSLPVIHLNGPNPKVFPVCKCSGIKGFLGRSKDSNSNDSALQAGQQRHYGADIKVRGASCVLFSCADGCSVPHSFLYRSVNLQEMIQKTAGAELCATHQNPKPSASDCVRAYDETYKGRVDLSKKVVVGDPVQKSGLHWSVPYDVTDAAGNKAATVWRDVIVEEVELDDVETRMRREFEKEKEAAVRKAVDQALADSQRRGSSRRPGQKCPECPKCDCSRAGGGFDEAACMVMCRERMGSCAVDEQSWIVRLMVWLEGSVPASLAAAVLAVLFLFAFLLLVRFVISFFVEQPPYQPPYDMNPEHLQQHVTVYKSPPLNGNGSRMNGGGYSDTLTSGGQVYATGGNSGLRDAGSYGGSNLPGGTNGGSSSFLAPPRSSMSLGDRDGNAGFFSPPSAGTRSYSSTAAVGRPSPSIDIYEQSPLITPNRRGDGVRRRSPFSR